MLCLGYYLGGDLLRIASAVSLECTGGIMDNDRNEKLESRVSIQFRVIPLPAMGLVRLVSENHYLKKYSYILNICFSFK